MNQRTHTSTFRSRQGKHLSLLLRFPLAVLADVLSPPPPFRLPPPFLLSSFPPFLSFSSFLSLSLSFVFNSPRNCIGQKFAQNEEKVIVAKVLKNFTLRSVDKEVPSYPELIMRPGKVKIEFKKR